MLTLIVDCQGTLCLYQVPNKKRDADCIPFFYSYFKYLCQLGIQFLG